MSAEIIKIYKEHLPRLRFVGKRYAEADRKGGGYAHKWAEWFANGWFADLAQLGMVKGVENGYVGLMRCDVSVCADTFEYWIGLFFPPQTDAPAGYEAIDIDEGDVGLCWIKGREDGGLYAMHDACIAKFREGGMDRFRRDRENRVCFFERYNCPRFTQPDEDGKVILDYGVYLAGE